MPSRPVPFTGTDTERQRNRNSHRWGGEDGRCLDCDHKQGHVGADYPCGAEVPREEFALPSWGREG